MQGLVDVDRGGVADGGLAGGGPDQAADTVAKGERHVEPAGGVPAADEVLAPFLRGGLLQFSEGGLGGDAERVAVEIDEAAGQDEAVAEGAERIGCIHGLDGGKVGNGSHRKILFTNGFAGGGGPAAAGGGMPAARQKETSW